MTNNSDNPVLSEQGQKTLILWCAGFTIIFAVTWFFLLKMAPPPPPTLSPEEMAAFFQENRFSILLGAMICSWVAAQMVPFWALVATQMYRLEKSHGLPIWTVITVMGGALMSMFLVFPPILWGVIAYSADRTPELSMMLMEVASLTLVTTDQFYIFAQVALSVVILRYPMDELSPFPRWYGWFNLWVAIAFEVGAVSFMTKTGPFAWDGVLVFWMPFVLFFAWIPVTLWLLWQGVSRQQAAKLAAA